MCFFYSICSADKSMIYWVIIILLHHVGRVHRHFPQLHFRLDVNLTLKLSFHMWFRYASVGHYLSWETRNANSLECACELICTSRYRHRLYHQLWSRIKTPDRTRLVLQTMKGQIFAMGRKYGLAVLIRSEISIVALFVLLI